MSQNRRLVLTDLIDSPKLSAAILGAGCLHVGLCAAGLGGWPCPFYQATGWPCPGCGLGRACVLLLNGQWRESLRLHAFAPVFLGMLALAAAGFILPARNRETVRNVVKRLEERGLSMFLLGGLVLYWAARFVLDAAPPELLAR